MSGYVAVYVMTQSGDDDVFLVEYGDRKIAANVVFDHIVDIMGEEAAWIDTVKVQSEEDGEFDVDLKVRVKYMVLEYREALTNE